MRLPLGSLAAVAACLPKGFACYEVARPSLSGLPSSSPAAVAACLPKGFACYEVARPSVSGLPSGSPAAFAARLPKALPAEGSLPKRRDETRRGGSSRQQPHRARSGRGAILDAEFYEHGLQMFVHRAWADRENFADFAIGLSAANPQQDLGFAAGERQTLLQHLFFGSEIDFGEAKQDLIWSQARDERILDATFA